jgi:hypothetical protein
MTAQALGDLVGILFELFVDDGGMAGDDFTETLTNIRTLLTRVREKGLSLSATNSALKSSLVPVFTLLEGGPGPRPVLIF